MEFTYERLEKDESFEKRIEITIKSHKLLVLYFDRDELFLYDRTMPITIKKLVMLLENIATGDYNV